jgi:hypothetical protein
MTSRFKKITLATVAAVAIFIAVPQAADAQWTRGWSGGYVPYTSYYTPYYGGYSSYYAPYGYYGYTVPYNSYYGYSYPYYVPQTTFRLGPMQVPGWY